MDRRWAGLVIVVVAVFAAAVAPTIAGRTMHGTAVAEPVPGPPAVGDCLTAPATAVWDQSGHPLYNSAVLAPCAATRFGEVVAVIRDGRPHQPTVPTIEAPTDGSAVTEDPNQLTCWDAAARYVGLIVTADHMPLVSSYWSPAAPIGIKPSGPTRRQKAAGQSWVACVLYVSDGLVADQMTRYATTLKGVYSQGTEPANFAMCLDRSTVTAANPVPCSEPHPAEAFGTTTTARAGLTQSALDDSCRVLVAKLTRMKDPTAGGQLRAMAYAVHGDNTQSPGLGKPDDQSGYAVCEVVVAGPRLSGTVLALGAKPVPWAH